MAAGVFYALGGFFTEIEAATLAATLTMGAAAVSGFASMIIAAGIVGAIGFVCPYIFVYSRGASNFVNSIYGIPDDMQQSFSKNQLAIKQTRAHLRLQLDALKPTPVEKPAQ